MKTNRLTLAQGLAVQITNQNPFTSALKSKIIILTKKIRFSYLEVQN